MTGPNRLPRGLILSHGRSKRFHNFRAGIRGHVAEVPRYSCCGIDAHQYRYPPLAALREISLSLFLTLFLFTATQTNAADADWRNDLEKLAEHDPRGEIKQAQELIRKA